MLITCRMGVAVAPMLREREEERGREPRHRGETKHKGDNKQIGLYLVVGTEVLTLLYVCVARGDAWLRLQCQILAREQGDSTLALGPTTETLAPPLDACQRQQNPSTPLLCAPEKGKEVRPVEPEANVFAEAAGAPEADVGAEASAPLETR